MDGYPLAVLASCLWPIPRRGTERTQYITFRAKRQTASEAVKKDKLTTDSDVVAWSVRWTIIAPDLDLSF
jgi:hypothetical protein